MKLEKWTGLLKKYRYAALIVLAGVVLMLLPTGGSKADSGGDSSEAAESFSLEETEKRMAEVLGTINGVGRVRIMLTLRSGSTLRLAEDSTISDSTGGQTKQEKQVLTVNRGSGRQEGTTRPRCSRRTATTGSSVSPSSAGRITTSWRRGITP